MENVFDLLKERGYIKQLSHEDEIRELLGKEKITFYIGFDPRPTACTSAILCSSWPWRTCNSTATPPSPCWAAAPP